MSQRKDLQPMGLPEHSATNPPLQPPTRFEAGEAAKAAATQVLREAGALMEDEKAEEARMLLSRYLDDQDNPSVWLKLSKIYRLLGDNAAARAILRNVVLKFSDPHIMEIIAARIPYSKMIVQEQLKILYVNIPKCGSSSIKDAVLLANQRGLRGETSHYHVREFERVLPFTELEKSFADFQRLAVIRHPRDRIRSYFSKNIEEAKSLVKEARGKLTFYGLSTTPSYSEIMMNFERYRNVFDDFRHHTDTIIGYLGQRKSRYTTILDVAETQKIIDLFHPTAEQKPVIHNMRSSRAMSQLSETDSAKETEILQTFYREELRIYFPNATR